MKIYVNRWAIEEMTGYKPQTTFWQDFSIADNFGKTAVRDTFNRAFREWRGNYIYLTEMVLVLNHKIWQHYKQGKPSSHPDNALAVLYDELWREASDYARENLKGAKLGYYYEVTD